MTEPEKKALKYAHALKHYERDGGYRGDVDLADVAAIQVRPRAVRVKLLLLSS